jgi:hypothetical protein
MLISTISFLVAIYGNIQFTVNGIFIQDTITFDKIAGTWETVDRSKYGPNITIIVDENQVFISVSRMGSGGYKQVLSYVIENNRVLGEEKEIMFIDQNIGHISGHYKHRKNEVELELVDDQGQTKLILYPISPGSVLMKSSESKVIDFNFEEQFSKWRIGSDFKCDYKRKKRR